MRAINLARIALYLIGMALALVAQSSGPGSHPSLQAVSTALGETPADLIPSLIAPLAIVVLETYVMLRGRLQPLRWLLGMDILVLISRGPIVVLPALVMFLTFRPSVKRFFGME